MKITEEKAFWSFIKKKREEQGFSQESFSQKIGMHRTNYNKVENSSTIPRLDTMLRVCDGLGLSIEIK